MPKITKNELMSRMGAEMPNFLKFLDGDDIDAGWMLIGFNNMESVNNTDPSFIAQIDLLVYKEVLTAECKIRLLE